MKIGWRGGRLALVAVVGLLGAGCGVPHTVMKVVRTLSPVRLVPSRRGLTSANEYDAAKKLVLRGKFRQAIIALDSWLSTYPGNALEPAAHYYLANSQAQVRRPKQAVATYQRLIKLFPESDWAAFARQDVAEIRRTGGRVLLARPRARWWHPGDWFTPDPPTVRRFNLGRTYFDRHHYDQAIVVFRTLAERHPDNPMAPAAWHYVGRSYERVAEIDKARQSFAIITQKYKGTHWEKLAADDLDRLRE